MSDEPMDDRYLQLEQENSDLRREVQQLRGRIRRTNGFLKGLSSLAARAILGRGLQSSIEGWLTAKTLRDPLPTKETAAVATAVFRRFVQVGTIALLLALLPAALMIWQNSLIQAQLDTDRSQSTLTRRTELVQFLFGVEARIGSSLSGGQAVQASTWRSTSRLRSEALVEFVSLERASDRRRSVTDVGAQHSDGERKSWRDWGTGRRLVDLARAQLAEIVLVQADLDEVLLREANLDEAYLPSASMNRTSLEYASLKGTHLRRATIEDSDLGRADLSGADLSYTTLRKSILFEVILEGTDLKDAILTGVSGLTCERLVQAKNWQSTTRDAQLLCEGSGISTG